MKNYTILFLAIIAIFSFKTNADIYTVTTNAGGSLGIDPIPVSIIGLDDSVDSVLFTFEVSDTTITNILLDIFGNGAGPGNFAILSGASFVAGTGIAPTVTQLNSYGEGYDLFVTYTFNPPLTNGQQSATLVLNLPLGFLAPFTPGPVSELAIGIAPNVDINGYGSSGTSVSIQTANMLEPSVSMSLSNQQAVVTWTGYVLQSSTNISAWQNVTNNIIIGSVTTFLPITNSPCLFLRAVN